LIWIGLSFHRTGVWLSNRALCTDILENNPRNYFAQVNLANDDLARGLLASAETHLQEARRLNPRLALAPANLANVYWQKRDPASILLEFEPLLHDREFLQYNLHEPQALALLYRMVARAHSILRHTSEARDDYQQALLINPYDEELKREVELFNAEQMH
jgi:tetratricopeptide (TPR) repeat protein